jgi:hypothetical protein
MGEKFFFDHANHKMYIQRTEDVESVIDEATEDRNNLNNGWSKKRHFRKIGTIPMIIVEKVLRERGINLMENSPEARKEAKKILNEMNKFRTVDKPV